MSLTLKCDKCGRFLTHPAPSWCIWCRREAQP